MARIVGSRVYLECERTMDSYMDEIMRIIDLGLERHAYIWDQTDQEPVENEANLVDMHLLANKGQDDGAKVFDRDRWLRLAAIIFPRARFVQLGFWKSEAQIGRALESEFEALRVDEYGEQIEMCFELSERMKEYIADNYLSGDGRISWFNFALFDALNSLNPLFSSAHFGEEYYINGLTLDEKESILSIVENDNFYVQINRHRICESEMFGEE